MVCPKGTITKIIDLHVEFICEMQAEGAWCGHAYATEYFGDLRSRMIELAKEIKEENDGKRKSVSECASHILFTLSTDYDGLITKLYQNAVFPEQDRNAIAEALNDAFKNKMEEAFGGFSYVCEQLSGKRYGPMIEKALGSES